MALISLALVIAWTAPPRLSAVEPRTIRVRNIPFESSEQDVQAAISAHFGEVSSVSLAEWGSKGGRKHRGWAVLEFAHSGSRRKALGGGVSIKLDGRELLLEEEEEVAKQSETPQLKKSRRRPRRHERSKPTVLASRREEALTFLERSRYRDFASKQDYQRAVASALSQIGALGNKDEYSIAIGAACRARDTSRCLKLLQGANIKELGVSAYNYALSSCVGPARWRDASKVLQAMPAGMPTVATYSLAIRACSKANQLAEALRLMRFIDLSEMRPEDDPGQTANEVAARKAMLTAVNAALQAAARLGRWREAVALLERLGKQRVRPNAASYLSAVSACARVEQKERVGSWRRDDPTIEAAERAAAAVAMIDDMERHGLDADLRCINAALRACALLADSKPGLELFGSIERRGLRPDLLSYSAALTCCGADEEEGCDSALALLDSMARNRIQPDVVTYGAAIAACATGGRWKEACELLARMEVPGSEVAPDIQCYNSCITALGRGDRCADALQMLGRLESHPRLQPTTVSYNAAISACERAGHWQDAVRLLDSMIHPTSAVQPSTVSLNAAISACEKAGEWRQAIRLLESFGGDAQGGAAAVRRDAASYTAALSAIATSGRLPQPQPQRKNAASSSNANGFGVESHGDGLEDEAKARAELGERAVALIRKVESSGVRPDAATYNAAISALEKAGAWQTALQLFDEMRSGNQIEPTLVTYNALMQALCSAGQVDHGFELLGRFEAAGLANTGKSYSLHRSLLQACRKHGTREQIERVQAAMSERGLRAIAPLAKAMHGGQLLRYTNQNRFTQTSNGTMSAVGEAARELWVRVARRRECHYKPVLEALPYAFTRRANRPEMVRSLQAHAEKLALADLLRREQEEGGDEAGHTLELSINFKVCEDCHAFFKAASRHLGRPITLREPKLTHVFEDGECRCGDSWRWETRHRGGRAGTVRGDTLGDSRSEGAATQAA